jgi:hypothetical protein
MANQPQPNVTFYQFTQFFNNIAIAHPNIETFTVGDIHEVDLAKQSIFPLLHMVPNNVTISPQMFNYDIDLVYMDRTMEVIPLSTGPYNQITKNYKTVTNTHDVWNTGLLAINDIIAYVTRNAQAQNFIITTDAIATPFQQSYDNVLAGWSVNMTIQVPNNVNACLFNITSQEAQGNMEDCTLSDPLYS